MKEKFTFPMCKYKLQRKYIHWGKWKCNELGGDLHLHCFNYGLIFLLPSMTQPCKEIFHKDVRNAFNLVSQSTTFQELQSLPNFLD